MKTMGVLVDPRVFHHIKDGKTGNEKIKLYNRAAKQHGLIPIYLCLEKMKPSLNKIVGYKYARGKYHVVNVAIPKVIHNRTLPKTKYLKNKLQRLRRHSIVFNAQNRYSKYVVHKLLIKSFALNLPKSMNYTRANLRTMMGKYDSLFIKPQNSSVGKGIIKITRRENKTWKIQWPKGSLIASKRLTEKKVNSYANKEKYVIQETIPLIKYKGNPSDLRVTVQRGSTGGWQVTGIIGKVARKGSHVTNVAQGGKVIKHTKLFQNNVRSPAMVTESVKQLSLNIAKHLGKRLDNLADIGLDIGVSTTGKPYFIEMNGRDQRYAFKKGKMSKTFYKTYETPVLYAKYLLNNMKKQ